MENINKLMQVYKIGQFPKIKLSLIGFFASVQCMQIGGYIAWKLTPNYVLITLSALTATVILWVVDRYINRDENSEWHWLTDPPQHQKPLAKRLNINPEITSIIQKKTKDETLIAEETRSNQYRILTIRNDNPEALGKSAIRAAIAIQNGIQNPDAVKFMPVFDVGKSAFLLPLPADEWEDVPFKEGAIKHGKPIVQLGVDLNGNDVTIDLKKNPHTCAAGMTGTGKTAWMMVYIKSLLESGLDPVLYIIDPNDNLGVFSEEAFNSGGSYIKELHEGANLLRALVEEPDDDEDIPAHPHNFIERKKRMIGSQNLWSFRAKGGTGEDARPVVVVVDEVAAYTVASDKDLKKQVVADLGVIARRFRAAGALLLVATQRPSADILPGEFLANCGNVIAFSHANRQSSQVTLGSSAASGIPGWGGFVAKFGGSELLTYGRATYLDL